MTYQLTVSPDYPPKQVAGWYIFNTWLQKALDIPIHLELYTDFDTQREAILADKVDLIYANPYDAALLLREKGFRAIARPTAKVDEALVVVRADSPYTSVDDLKPGLRLAIANDPAVNLLGKMMLEPAEIDPESDLETFKVDSYPAVANLLLQEKADIAFFLKSAFEKLTAHTREPMRVLVESQIGDLYHLFLASPRMAEHYDALQQALVGMADSPKGQDALANLDLTGWEPVSEEEADFMVNLIEALK